MSLFSSAKGNAGPSVIAIFDIGSGSVGASLVSFSQTKLPYMVWSKRIPITFQESLSYDKLSKTMLSTLLDISLEMQSAGYPMLKQLPGSPKVDDIMFAFASPWYSVQAKVFKVEKDEPFQINEQFIKNLIKKEEENFKQGAQKADSNPEEGIVPILIERQVIQTALNGYIVSDPYNKTVKNAQLDVVLSSIPSYIYEKAEEIKTQLLGTKDKGRYHSFLLPSFTATREVFHNNTNFLLVDVSAEITDVATVNKGTIVDATSFPIGKHSVVRKVANRLNTTPDEALSLLNVFLEGNSNSVQTEQLKGVLKEIEEEWLKAFTETLSRISTEAPLPKNLFLTVDDDYGEWFKRVIAAGKFTEFTLSQAPFKITVLGEEMLGEHIECNKLTSSLDPFLAIEALYLQKTLYEQSPF